jgi:predicted transposase/invertase (TIGR01784 family)
MDEAARREAAVAEGEARGRAESKFEVARNFLKMGLPLDQIAQGTDLSVEEISALG